LHEHIEGGAKYRAQFALSQTNADRMATTLWRHYDNLSFD
jgi:hypothetical protein